MAVPDNDKQIKKCEAEIDRLELEIATWKAKLKLLQSKQSAALGIKWVDEIRRTLQSPDGSKRAITIEHILFNIQTKYKVTPDRYIKNKIGTTLSRLYKDGEIMKTEYQNKIVYGYPEIFKADGMTIKEEYLKGKPML